MYSVCICLLYVYRYMYMYARYWLVHCTCVGGVRLPDSPSLPPSLSSPSFPPSLPPSLFLTFSHQV